MHRSNSYTYAASHTMAGHSRYSSTHASSSAFSASANPNEDWTKISDLAERRRIQNRIAQRNYRKKLKRRLEDLERRAGSSSASPEQSHSELATTQSKDCERPLTHTMSRKSSKSSSIPEKQRLSPEVLPLDDQSSLYESSSSRHYSVSSQPTFSFPPYPTTQSYIPAEYPQTTTTTSDQPPSYETTNNFYSQYPYPGDFTQSLAATLPAMVPASYAKQESFFSDEDLLNPFSMNYASLAGFEMPSTEAYSASAHTHSPPLTEPYSMDDSRLTTPSYYDMPMTPLSRPASPNVQVFGIACN